MKPRMDRLRDIFSFLCALPRGKAGRLALIHLFVIGFVGFVAYSNTLESPFIWDDRNLVMENPAVKDISLFVEPSKVKGTEFYTGIKNRYIGYLTFALNYKLHGFDVRGYHIFNISVHILNAILVYLLVLLTFETPFLREAPLRGHSGHLALFSGLIFVTHPVHTEAVTYIFQRFASLMTFYYLMALVAYISSAIFRDTPLRPLRYPLYALSLISAVLAMKIKENAVTLPQVIVLYEILFFSRYEPEKGVIRGLRACLPLRILPFILILLIIPLSLLVPNEELSEGILSLDSAARGATEMSRTGYLFTQFRAVVTYIRLLFFPVNQNLDYDFPVFNSFFSPEVFLSFLFLLSVFAMGMYFLYRSKARAAVLRLSAFGIFWFFMTLSIESSLVPLPTLLNEYRLYLPSVGAFLAVLSGIYIVVGRLKNRKLQLTAFYAAVLVPVVLLLYTTSLRNATYRTMTSIWEDVVRKSPQNPRAHYNLGVAFQSEGRPDRAAEHFHKSIRLNPDCADSHFNLGLILYQYGSIEAAIEHYSQALNLRPDAGTHNNLAICYAAKGMTDLAIEHCKKALEMNPEFPEAYFNLGLALMEKGIVEGACKSFSKALDINPSHKGAQKYLKMLASSPPQLNLSW